MSKKGSKLVTPPKDRRAAKLSAGTITSEQLRKIEKAKTRRERIESGIRQTGAGVHGGGKRDINRRQRRQSKIDVKSVL